MKDNKIWLPQDIGSGYIKVEEFANGLQVLFNECTLHQPALFHRKKSDGNGYTLRFDEVRNLKALSAKIGETILKIIQLSIPELFYPIHFLNWNIW